MKKRHSQKKPSLFSGILAFFILFVIAATILNYLLPVLIAAVIVVGTVYMISKFLNHHERMPTYSTDDVPSSNFSASQNEYIKRQLAILMESTELVNNSNNLDTVLRRYSIVCNTLEKLSTYTDQEIINAGYFLKEPLSNTLHFLQESKAVVINQAIERHIRNEISKLTTENGKLKKINSLHEKIKSNEALETANISFLEKLCNSLKEELLPVSTPIIEIADSTYALLPETEQATDISPSSLPETISPDSESTLKVSPEIIDLLWIGDGKYKNYSPSAKQSTPYNSVTIISSSDTSEEPSALYLSLSVSTPSENTLVEHPPYYPSYKGLSPEQRWLYWKFLADPFSPRHNIGYVFLFLYGLERHLASGNLDKAFHTILELRKVHSNASFQSYTANALTLICIVKQRADLALKLIRAESDNMETSMPTDYLLILKYTFQMPLTVSEIIKNHKYFEFHNNRYIKGQPDLFSQTLSGFLLRDFQADSINLNKYFPMDINGLPTKSERIFANISLSGCEASVPDFKNRKLIQKISSLLLETHETVKSNLRKLRKTGGESCQPINIP